MKNRFRLGFALLLLLVSFVVTGCGSEENDPTIITVNQRLASLAFLQQPQTVNAGQTLPNIVVELRDANGQRLTQANGEVLLQFGNNGNGAQLTQNGQAQNLIRGNAAGGIATFSGLSIAQPGANYTLIASAVDLTNNSNVIQVTSAPFNVNGQLQQQ